MSAQINKRHIIQIVIAFAAIYTIWGTTYLAIRIAVETIPEDYPATFAPVAVHGFGDPCHPGL